MKIRYIGPFEEGVEIDDPAQPSRAVIHCLHGKAVDLPDEVALGFLEQEDNWQRVDSPSKPAAKTEAVGTPPTDGPGG